MDIIDNKYHYSSPHQFNSTQKTIKTHKMEEAINFKYITWINVLIIGMAILVNILCVWYLFEENKSKTSSMTLQFMVPKNILLFIGS